MAFIEKNMEITHWSILVFVEQREMIAFVQIDLFCHLYYFKIMFNSIWCYLNSVDNTIIKYIWCINLMKLHFKQRDPYSTVYCFITHMLTSKVQEPLFLLSAAIPTFTNRLLFTWNMKLEMSVSGLHSKM